MPPSFGADRFRSRDCLCRNQAARSSQWFALKELPPTLGEPGTRFLFAVDIPFACDEQELSCHEGCKRRVGVRRIGPEVHEQQASTVRNALTGAPEQLQIM